MDSNSKIFMAISIISWTLLLITGWMSFGVPKIHNGLGDNGTLFWLIDHINKDEVYANSFDVYYILFYIIIILTLILATAGFLVYIYSIFISKNDNVVNGMLGNISKFHFIPLLCISALFIIGETLKRGNALFGAYTGIHSTVQTVHCAFNLIFCIIGLGSLIYICLNTKISEPMYANLTINKGMYSCFIALLVYNFGFVATLSNFLANIDERGYDVAKNVKGFGYAFSIIIGVANIFLSIFLKDIMIGFINILLYIGMIINFFKIHEDVKEYLYNNDDGIGIAQIVMLVLSICSLGFIIVKYKSKLLNNNE